MIKVNLNSIPYRRNADINCDDPYLPFSLRVEKTSSPVESVYVKNQSGENFIELWFNKNDRLLREVVMVTVDKNSIQEARYTFTNVKSDIIYNCILAEDSLLEFSEPMKIFKEKLTFCVSWATHDTDVRQFLIADNFAVGLDPSGYLVSIILKNLSNSDIANIL